ncbi:MAG: hypothetical protein ACFBSF_08955 [Leptolyngbyaceae cyanobacterium]
MKSILVPSMQPLAQASVLLINHQHTASALSPCQTQTRDPSIYSL